MALHLVRHGRVLDHLLDGTDNPPLSDLGRRQAEALAGMLRADYLASSPLLRAIQTAEPIAGATGLDIEVVPAVGEVVPGEYDAGARQSFLRDFLRSTWAAQPDWLREWRGSVLDAMNRLAQWGQDVVVVTHYVAINVAAGHATGDDRVTVFQPENTSVSSFLVGEGGFEVVALGRAL